MLSICIVRREVDESIVETRVCIVRLKSEMKV